MSSWPGQIRTSAEIKGFLVTVVSVFVFVFFSVSQRSNRDTSLEMGLLECSEPFSLLQGPQACWFYSYYGCDLVDCQGHHGAAEIENSVANVKIPGTSG